MERLRSFLGRNRQCAIAIWSSLANRQRQTAECCDPDLEAAITLAIMDYDGSLKPDNEA